MSVKLKADILTPSEQIFKELNWLSFPKLVQYHTCLMVYESMNGMSPEYIFNALTCLDHHERQIGSTTNLIHVPRSHSAYFDQWPNTGMKTGSG